MLSVFRFSRGGVLCRIVGLLVLAALGFITGCTTSNSGTVTIGPPAKLAFTMQPGNVGAAATITVTVSIEDASGNVVPTATNQVTIAIGTNPSGGTLSGTATATAVAGVATFSNLSINNVGTGYTLMASTTGLTSGASSTFNVVGPPTKLAFTVQPSSVGAGGSVTPAVTVSIEDASGNVVPTATNQVTIAIGTNPSIGTLSGTAQANAVAGVATFSTLSINKVGTGYTLTASATGLINATSSAFNVTAGAAAKLAFTVQPSNTTAGAAINPAVQVTIEDGQGNVVTTATNTITIGAGSVAVTGTTAANAVNGVATFSNLNINLAGTGYTLTASATGLTGATSSSFNVTVGAAAKLVFTTEPSNVAAGSSINPSITVSVEDVAGNVVSTATNQITIAIGTNPSSGTLSGTAQANAVAGVATFSTLSINKVATGYTLMASATGLTNATSSAFNVTAGAAAKLAFTVQPSNTTAGAAINPAVQVTIEDSQGNVVTTATNTITIVAGSVAVTGTTAANAVNGVATFSNLTISVAGTGYTLTAVAGSLSVTSSAFNVTAGAAAKLAFTQQPTNIVAGSSITPAVAVNIEDAQGNVVPTATTQITIVIGTNPSSGTLTGAAQVNAVSGVATFPTLSINKSGTGYTLIASAAALTGATSSAFNVTAGAAAKLAFTAQPVNTVAASNIAPAVTVSIEDSLGNVATTAMNPITIAIGTNPSNGTLGGTLTASAVNGVATFSNLTVNNTGTGYTLTASATGLTGIVSNAFNIIVSIGPPAKLAFTQQPSNVVAGSSITPAVQVTVEDSNGNQVTSATNSITIAIGTNPSSGTLGGTLTVNASSGVATFSNLSINHAGTGYTLAASASSLTGATSSAFNVTAGTAAKLAFTVQPSNVASQISITPGVAVSVEDSLGNVVSSATNQITVAIQNNPSSGTLGGTVAVNAVSGVATFSNLTINNAGTGYTLTASASSLTSATSNAFNVTAGAAAKLAFTVQPSNVASGSSITPAVQVSIEDNQGNLVTSATNQITIAIGTNPSIGTLSGTAVANAVNGVATFSTVSINNTGTGYTLTASGTGFTTITSSAFNVTASCTTNCTLSGTINPGGPQLSGVTITITGPAPSSINTITTTNASGAYSFTNLAPGSYLVTPTLAGYTFSPAAPNVNVSGNATQNFTETSALTSYSISGLVSYAGAKTGRVFILVLPSGCTGCNAVAGTSIALTSGSGSYTVRGLLPAGTGQNGNGSFTVFAEMDTLGTGQENDSNPSGSNPSTVTITNADVTGVNLTLMDPNPTPTPAPLDSTQISVSPGNGVAVLQYKAPVDLNGVEIASSYNVYYGPTNPPTNVKNFTAQGHHQNVFILNGLTNGATNFQISALVGTTESAKSTVISTTIGATTGNFMVSGTVIVPAGTGNGPLYVGVYGGASGHSIYVQRIATPYTSPVSYSVSGVPNGTYQNFAIIDENNDGEINVPDLDNVGNHGNPPTIVVNSANVTTANLDLTSQNVPSSVQVSTNYQQFGGCGGSCYNLSFQVNWGTKRPVAITLISGANTPVPFDMSVDENNSAQSPTFPNGVLPVVGDTYQFQLLFSDGTSQTLSSTVTAVLGANNVATTLGETTTTPYSRTIPLFTWAAPLSPPTVYYYGICVNGPSLNWCDYGHGSGNGLPSSTLSLMYNADGSASSPSLTSGTQYNFNVQVQDANGNSAQTSSTYVP